MQNSTLHNFEIISYYTGYIILGTAVLMAIPILTALAFAEWDPLCDFVISMSLTMLVGILLIFLGRQTRARRADVQWKHGFVIASLSWIFLTALCAVPYRLSGHSASFLDSCFDVMSGFTTTGLVLTQDLDHLSNALNMWRHLLTFIGGQGMVVLALTFLAKGTNGAYRLYVGEAKDIELVPNVKGTARIIWKISFIYLAVGTAALWLDGLLIGLKPVSAFLHALYMFESSWSTGGFAPMTQNIMYYHSLSYEIITIVIFVLGSFNFGLHYAVWQGNRKELFKNIEIRSFFITSTAACLMALAWLMKRGVYPDALSAFRRIVFNVLSAHTTTGLGSIYARQFALDWGDFGIMVMVIVMLIGGSACSTAGGFKGLRVGVIMKGIVKEVKKLLTSERNLRVYKFHYIKEQPLSDDVVRSASLIVICYIILFSIGTMLGTTCGYSLAQSAFEAATVTGNVGLSIGITSPSMPAVLKIYDIIAMFMGRLEFLSVFALIGYSGGAVIRQCKKVFK
ncbi:MAG: TrkH family potassium uptake protein [Clostridiales bacterium]|jgi:trk system potassium uptake protein TrkH|nr:TrkH family potassium uptake protein [Clostridiales bacterium]